MLKLVLHRSMCSTIIYALLTNDIIVLWRFRSRTCGRFLNSMLLMLPGD